MGWSNADQSREDRDKSFSDASSRSLGGLGGRDDYPSGRDSGGGDRDRAVANQRASIEARGRQNAAITSRLSAQRNTGYLSAIEDRGRQNAAITSRLSAQPQSLWDQAGSYLQNFNMADFINSPPGPLTPMAMAMYHANKFIGGLLPVNDTSPDYTTKGNMVPGTDIPGRMSYEDSYAPFAREGEDPQIPLLPQGALASLNTPGQTTIAQGDTTIPTSSGLNFPPTAIKQLPLRGIDGIYHQYVSHKHSDTQPHPHPYGGSRVG